MSTSNGIGGTRVCKHALHVMFTDKSKGLALKSIFRGPIKATMTSRDEERMLLETETKYRTSFKKSSRQGSTQSLFKGVTINRF
jgi:hypothetical protein